MDDDELRCQVILRHRDAKHLRALYEKIVEAADADTDSFNASEATRDFMARLRIGIMADQAPAPSPKEGLPNDIAFSQDVISRHARLEWHYEDASFIDFESWIPPRWSRRKPTSVDDMKSVVYLCCPVQSAEGWTYLTAITSFLKGDWENDAARRLLPARQLDFRDKATASIFEETHNLANWVVNYDELLDRRQLLNQNVQVIRYKQIGTQGRNLIISSKAPLSLLRAMVLSRVKSLGLELSEKEYQNLAEKFIKDAKDISGDIVLRAARHGRNASELMGVVLSRFLVQHELGIGKHFGWYFLDDYAEWLGQREEQIADLLMLSPEETTDGTLRLAVVITEAKYIEASGLTVKRRESQKQLRDTLKRIGEALFGNPERLDRELWLARLSDLLLDGVRFPANAGIALGRWRRALREGLCEINLRGYSHVFVSGPDETIDRSDFALVAGVDGAYQEVFSRMQVRDLALRYFYERDPLSIRCQSADIESILMQRIYSRPPGFPTREYSVQILQPEVQGHGLSEKEKPNEESPAEASVTSRTADASSVASPNNDERSDVSLTGKSDSQQTGLNTTWSSSSIQALLDEWTAEDRSENDDLPWLKQIESRAKAALQQFQLQAKLLKSVLTPNSALLKFAGSDNLTVDQVLKRRSEFLTTHGLNIISVGPEPGMVSIAIERPQRRIVQLPEVWRSWQPPQGGGNQELVIGVRESDGELLFLSPGRRHAPHTLIAGSTGSGKSVLMQNIILGIAATNKPEEAGIILIDPKQGVDYFPFDGTPHLMYGIIDSQEEALNKLQTLVGEMDRRYAKFKEARASNLDSYNRRAVISERLPVIWVIHDEFAEWMMVEEYKEEVTSLVGRLGVKARAAGLYLIFAAQRPDANVMPMQLRANLGNRLALRVDSEGTSEIALGERGAERLLGRGHLIAKLEGEALSYAQVPFIEEEIIIRMVEAISSQYSG
jgi:S-DNA-T family DNA segregation ATPase FtsK/SpoIIIE